ncbi:MAG TPA: hypothetical protein PLP01_08215 [Phycisphaerae bacterium]|mgnify:CR=1 FL=1|nr:hypothetical protein [Phycisphaerae bacterium]
MSPMKTWSPYLWALPLGAFSWYMTHHQLAVNPWAVFLIILAGYSTTLVACHRKPISIHQVGHLIMFQIVTFLGFVGSGLEGVSGILYMIPIVGAAGVVVLGAVVLGLARMVVPSRDVVGRDGPRGT